MYIPLDKKLSLSERNDIIIFIDEHIDDLSFNDKKDILTMLKNNIKDINKFKNKGTGTQINYKDLSNDLIIWIYNRISSKISN